MKFHEVLKAEDFMKYTWQAIRNARIVSNGQTPDAAAQYATNNIINTLGYNPYNVVNPIDDKGNVVANAKLLWILIGKESLSIIQLSSRNTD